MADIDQALLDQAHAYRIDGKYDEAHPCYQQLLDASPDCAEGWWGLGLTVMNQGEFDESIEYLKKAAALVPDSQRYVLDLGKHCAMLGMDDEAKAAYEKVVALDPNSREGADAATQLSYY